MIDPDLLHYFLQNNFFPFMPLYSHLFILNYKKKGLKHNILSFLNNLCWFIRWKSCLHMQQLTLWATHGASLEPKSVLLVNCWLKKHQALGLPGGSAAKNGPAHARRMVHEDPMDCGTPKPTLHNYCDCAWEPWNNSWSLNTLEPVLCNKKSRHSEKSERRN